MYTHTYYNNDTNDNTYDSNDNNDDHNNNNNNNDDNTDNNYTNNSNDTNNSNPAFDVMAAYYKIDHRGSSVKFGNDADNISMAPAQG